MLWVLFFPILLQILVVECFPIFNFNSSCSTSTATSSYAFLAKDMDLPSGFIFCSSIKQARYDHIGFFSVDGRDSPDWMRMQFLTFPDSTKLTLRWGEKYHRLDALPNPRLDFWYHICARFNLNEGKMEVSVNGLPLGRVVDANLTNIPSKLKMKIGVGWGDQQFEGSVSNIRLLKDGDQTDLSTFPCNNRPNPILAWNPDDWKVVGSHWTLTEEFDHLFCESSDSYNLAIASKVSFEESLDICKHMLKNSVIPFSQDYELFVKYVAWLDFTTRGSCPYVWTPFSDQRSEGLFLDMSNNTEADPKFWDKDEPNGGKDENFVEIDVAEKALNDVGDTRRICTSCQIPASLLLRLDGRCAESLIGNIKSLNFLIVAAFEFQIIGIKF